MKVFAADYEGQQIGHITVGFHEYPQGRTLVIHELEVAEPYRRCGVATNLLRKAISYATQNGCRLVELLAYPDNPATKLYTKLGFKARTDVLPFTLDLTTKESCARLEDSCAAP